MSSRTISDLRDVLFAQLERLEANCTADELERAKAVAGIEKEINQSAKIEVDHLRVTGAAGGSGFIPSAEATTPGAGRLGVQKPPMAMINNSRSGR